MLELAVFFHESLARESDFLGIFAFNVITVAAIFAQHSRGHLCTNGTGEFILALVKDHLKHAMFIPQLQNLLVTPSTGGQWITEDEEPPPTPLPPFCT